MIDFLLTAPDTFELVRDRVYELLNDEQANQRALAVDAGLNPFDYALDVYKERANPVSFWREDDANFVPIVNVLFNSANDNGTGDGKKTFRFDGVFQIEIIAGAINDSVNNISADIIASANLDRAIKLVRNILSYSAYKKLGFISNIGSKTISSIVKNAPSDANDGTIMIQSATLKLDVSYYETSPQETPDILDLIEVDTKRAQDGSQYFVAKFLKGN